MFTSSFARRASWVVRAFPVHGKHSHLGSVEYVWWWIGAGARHRGTYLPQQSAGNPRTTLAELRRQRRLGVHEIRHAVATQRSMPPTESSLTTTRIQILAPTDGRESHAADADVDGAGDRRHDQDDDAFRKPPYIGIGRIGATTTTRARSRTPSICSASFGRIRRRAQSSGSTATSTSTSRRPGRRRPWRRLPTPTKYESYGYPSSAHPGGVNVAFCGGPGRVHC